MGAARRHDVRTRQAVPGHVAHDAVGLTERPEKRLDLRGGGPVVDHLAGLGILQRDAPSV